MSEQATETIEEVDTIDPSLGVIHEEGEAPLVEDESTETPELEAEASETLETKPDEIADDADEVEIVLDGEDQPASKPLRENGFYKRLRRVTGQRDAATEEAEELKRSLATKDEELKLYRMRLEQESAVPQEANFDTFEDFEAAKNAYDKQKEDERIANLVAQQTREQIESLQAQNTQQAQIQEFDAKFAEAEQQADKLKIKDFDQVGETAIDLMGQPLVEYILANHGQSAAMLFKLTKNPGKAREFHDLSLNPQLNGVKLAQALTRFEDGIQFKPKTTQPAADPETTIDKGVSTAEAQYLKGARFE